jgi:serine protease Do
MTPRLPAVRAALAFCALPAAPISWALSLALLAPTAALNAAPLAQLGEAPSVSPEANEYARRFTPIVQVVRSVGPAVVYIETDQRLAVGYDFLGRRVERDAVSSGSGVVIYEEGYIVTNCHVVAGARKIRVKFDQAHDAQTYAAELISASPSEDLALLKLESDGPFPTVPMGTSNDLMPGETVIAIGNPYGQTHTVSSGIISGLHRQVEVDTEGGRLRFENLIQTDASINPGNSGGPLLDINGRLIGINSVMNRQAENIGFAIPVDRVKQVLEEHLLAPAQARSWLGFELDLPKLELTRVWPGSPAAESGLSAGDRILAWNGKAVGDADQYRLARLALQPEHEVALSIARAGEARELVLRGWGRVDGLLFERLGATVESIAIGDRWNSVRRVRIAKLRPDGPAAKLGLELGDVLHSLRAGGAAGRSYVCTDPQELALLVSRLRPQSSLQIDVLRDEDGDGVLERDQEPSEMLRGELVLD